MELLFMEHEGIEGFARTSAEAFEVVWKAKGWVLVESPTPEEVAAADLPQPSAPVLPTPKSAPDEAVTGG